MHLPHRFDTCATRRHDRIMNEPNDSEMIQRVAVIGVLRPGLIDRLKEQAGIKSDDAFARLIGVSRASLARYKAGEEVSMRAVVGISAAFGLGLGEVAIAVDIEEDTLAEAS